MSRKELIAHRQRLDALFKNSDILNGDIELQAHWARYLCVLVSGYLETSIRLIMSEYVKNKSNDKITRYVYRRLADFQNPKMGKIIELVNSLDEKWGEDLEAVTRDKLKDTIDTIVNNRNNIAHGASTTLSLSRISDLFKDAKDLVDMIQDLFDGNPLAIPSESEVELCPTCRRKVPAKR